MNEVTAADPKAEQLQEEVQIVHVPSYDAKCLHPGCVARSQYALVLHFWPVDRPSQTRGIHNSVRMFPAVVACGAHAKNMALAGERMLDKAVRHVRELFTKLSLSDPDLKDCLIDVRTLDEALKMWQEEPGHTTLIVH
jgi:hypothetical protein